MTAGTISTEAVFGMFLAIEGTVLLMAKSMVTDDDLRQRFDNHMERYHADD